MASGVISGVDLEVLEVLVRGLSRMVSRMASERCYAGQSVGHWVDVENGQQNGFRTGLTISELV